VPAPPVVTGDSATDANAFSSYNKDGVVSGWFKSFSNNAMAYSVGAEYMYNDQFALRAGYYGDTKAMGKRSYFTMGVGLNYNIFGLNFSYLLPSGNGVNRNPLSNTLRFSLLFNLGGETESTGGAAAGSTSMVRF